MSFNVVTSFLASLRRQASAFLACFLPLMCPSNTLHTALGERAHQPQASSYESLLNCL